MSDSNLTSFADLAVEAAQIAGNILLEGFHREKIVDTKISDIDLVTQYDHACEKAIIAHIKASYPDHKFIAEESADGKYDLDDAVTWCIDPIDGTMNFVHQVPRCCVSIGVAIKKELVIGVVYNICRSELFHAIKGRGAFLNDQPIHVSPNSVTLDAALLHSGFPATRDRVLMDTLTADYVKMLLSCRSVRIMGSAALDLCDVACGRADGYWQTRLGPWDVAAGAVIVREAGGVVQSACNDEFDFISGSISVASHAQLLEEMASVLQSSHPASHT